MPSSGTLHITRALTDFALKYGQGTYIAGDVFPLKTTKNKSDKYFIYGRQDKRIADALRANGASGNEVEPWSISGTGTFACEEYSLEKIVTYLDQDDADAPIDPMMDTTEGLAEMLLLNWENRVAALVTAAANYATSGNTVTLTTTQQWNNASFSSTSKTDAIRVRIDTAKEAIRQQTGVYPTDIVIPASVANVVARDSEVLELLKYTHGDQLANGALPPALWNLTVHVPGAIKDGSNFGQTFSGTDVWGKHVLLYYKMPGSARKGMTFGWTFENKPFQSTVEKADGKKGDRVELSHIVDEKMISEYCGYLIRDAIA